MKKTFKGYVIGFLSAALVITGIGYAADTTTLYNVLMQGVKIVIDGQKINPTDANGNTVEPIIYNGTTYLPVRAVAGALGKAVYWDGPNYTVYLGNMDGKLEYPSKELTGNDNMGTYWENTSASELKDYYGNSYSRAISPRYTSISEQEFEYLCNYKYSKLKGTIYISSKYKGDSTFKIVVKTDGKTVYTSSELDKRSAPINLDVNITGCNDLEIICVTGGYGADAAYVCIGDLGLYQ